MNYLKLHLINKWFNVSKTNKCIFLTGEVELCSSYWVLVGKKLSQMEV